MGKDKESVYRQLVEDLNKHSFLYHVKQAPIISDDEYNQLYRKLVELEKQFPDLISSDSPTQRVGETASSHFQKFKHPIRMYSLENVFSIDDLKKYYKRFAALRQEFSPSDVNQFYCDCKMDGLAIDLIYRDGKFTLGLTRGDGIEGEDVTANLLTVPNIPKRIRTKQTVFVRGEIVVHKADFYAVNREREMKKLSQFSNPRNYASGSLRQKDPEITRKRMLRFYAWEMIVPNKKAISHDEQIKHLVDFGFNTPVGQLCTSIEEIISFINETARVRNELPYLIDGVVIKQNEPVYRKILGWNNHAPLWATAWKFTAEGAETTITRIVWGMGKTGKLTPVAKLKPVNINGVVVSEVNLANADYVENNKLGPSAKVRIIRSGDVTPKVAEIITKGTYLGVPKKCPFCHSELVRTGAEIRCMNPECEEILIASLQYLVSKDALNVKGIGDQFIREMITSKTASSLIDLFSPLESKSKNLSQDSLDELVTRTRNINMMELLMILGINGMGRAIAGKLTTEVMNVEGLIETLENEKQLRLLPINEAVKKSMISWYQKDYNKQLLKDIYNLHLPYCD